MKMPPAKPGWFYVEYPEGPSPFMSLGAALANATLFEGEVKLHHRAPLRTRLSWWVYRRLFL